MKNRIIIVLITLISFSKISISQNIFYDSLKRNAVSFAINDLHTSLSKTATLPIKDFYLVGEWHGTNANLLIEYEMIQYLYEHNNVENIIIEMPHSEVFFFQKYIETGDISVLHNNYDGRINRAFLDKIIMFNKTKKNKVRLFGIDIDVKFGPYFYTDCILYLVKKYNYNDTISLFGNAINTLLENRNNQSQLRRINEIFIKEITNNEALYASIFKEDFLHLKTVVLSNKKDRGRRDDELFENFKNLHNIWFSKVEKKARFLAFFGASHTTNNKKAFYSILKNNSTSPVYNNVSLSAIQYLNCASSGFARSPEKLFYIYNAGFVNGKTSGYDKVKKNDFHYAFETLCNSDSSSNFFVRLFKNNPFLQWKNANHPFSDMDCIFIVQNITSTHPLKK
jgi:hypothetical protein